MAQQISRINLSAARFPLVSDFHGRTIILPQYDMNFQKSAIFAGNDQDRDVGVPQVFYMENVMPTEHGYQSVSFSQVVAGIGANDFDQAIALTDPDGDKFIFVPSAGKNYVFDAPVLSWATGGSIGGLADDVLVTSAFVQGETYIFYEKTGCYKYNKTTKLFEPVVLAGLVVTGIVGIVGTNGYLLCWDEAGTLYWSSATNPLDFVPSLVTGASSGSITDLRGKIVVILATLNGFIVYGTENAVGGSFTANIRFPFNMKEIPGSGGVRSKEHISYESNYDKQYAITSVGLQAFTKSSSETLLPECADFLTQRVFESYSTVTKLLTVEYLADDLVVKLTIIGTRYLIISYGKESLTHALIYDMVQKKWGKVKIDHVDCFQFKYPNLYGEVTYAMLEALGTLYSDFGPTTYDDLSTSMTAADKPKRNLGFLQADGRIVVLDFDLGASDHSGVFMIGKFQFTRRHYMQLLGFEIESIDQGSNYAAFILPSPDGKNFSAAVTPYLKVNTGKLREYQCRNTAESHTLLFEGSFHLTSGLIRYAPGGMMR